MLEIGQQNKFEDIMIKYFLVNNKKSRNHKRRGTSHED